MLPENGLYFRATHFTGNDRLEWTVFVLYLGEAVGIRPKGMIKGLAGNIGPVRRECLLGAGPGIDISGYIPGFRICQLRRIVT